VNVQGFGSPVVRESTTPRKPPDSAGVRGKTLCGGESYWTWPAAAPVPTPRRMRAPNTPSQDGTIMSRTRGGQPALGACRGGAEVCITLTDKPGSK